MTTSAEAIRRHTGAPLFANGFRPFFLFAAAWAGLAVPIWAASYLFGDGTVAGMDGRAWHVREMLFGVLPGVIAGFLLTAVPNWTGRLPVTGARLAALFALWAAGRAASLLAGVVGPAALVVDAAFPVVFAAVIWREVLAGRNLKNLPVCLLVTLLAVGGIAFRLTDALPSLGLAPVRIALSAVAGLLALIGGRVVPSFTNNWMIGRGLGALAAPFGTFDKGLLALTGLALGAWVFAPESVVAGLLLALAGAGHLIRLWRWRGWKTLADPLVWILHLGYGWLGLAFVVLGAGVLWPGAVPASSGVHALTAGAVGVMVLATMTRASLGHTGRERVASRATRTIYLLVNAAAALRVAAPMLGGGMVPAMAVSAALWSAAFLGFALAYGPMLCAPRWTPARAGV